MKKKIPASATGPTRRAAANLPSSAGRCSFVRVRIDEPGFADALLQAANRNVRMKLVSRRQAEILLNPPQPEQVDAVLAAAPRRARARGRTARAPHRTARSASSSGDDDPASDATRIRSKRGEEHRETGRSLEGGTGTDDASAGVRASEKGRARVAAALAARLARPLAVGERDGRFRRAAAALADLLLADLSAFPPPRDTEGER